MSYDVVCARERWYKHFYLADSVLWNCVKALKLTYEEKGRHVDLQDGYSANVVITKYLRGKLLICVTLYEKEKEVFVIRCLCKRCVNDDCLVVEHYTIGAFV